jgi:hypothetical protein
VGRGEIFRKDGCVWKQFNKTGALETTEVISVENHFFDNII